MAGPAQHKVKFTYEDYVLFPDDGKRHEIIGGDHFMTPSPSTRHQRILLNIAGPLDLHARRTKAGTLFCAPMDVVLSETDVVQPDALFIAASRSSIVTEANIQGPPDLAVEILSPASRKADETVKRKLYERCGVREYWVVDPELETVVVYRLEQERYRRALELSRAAGETVQTPLLPGFVLSLADVFS